MTERYTAIVPTPIGDLPLVASDAGLVAIRWAGDAPPAGAVPAPGHAVLAAAAAQLTEYFAGTRRAFDLPLDPAGTPFQRSVWAALATIPFGATVSYAAIARAIERPTATRAVGAANGQNPLPIVVPCHRVIGSGGALTGFGGGLAIKRWLLAHEGAMLV